MRTQANVSKMLGSSGCFETKGSHTAPTPTIAASAHTATAVADGTSPRIARLTMKFSNLWLWDASPAPPTATAYLVDPVG
jgi:hypothetical protein